MARERTHATKVRFVIVSLISYALNSFWVWLLFTHLAARAAVRRSCRCCSSRPRSPSSSTANGFSADGARRLPADGGARSAPLVVPRAARGARGADPPRGESAGGCADPRDRLRHRPQSRDARRSSGASMRSSSTTRPGRIAEQRLGRKVMSAPLPELAGVKSSHYDLIAAFDVIEHIDDDAAALASIATRLKPGGKLVMTVPAHQWMWSAHDVVNHHKRRYSKRGAQAADRGIAAEARARSAISTACCSRSRSPSASRRSCAARTTPTSSCRPRRSTRRWKQPSRPSVT